MTLSESIRTCFKKYIDFSGRAQRSELWWFFLFCVVSQAILGIVPIIGGIYSLVLMLVLMMPSLAVAARRLHDTGRSAWWLLLFLASIPAMVVAGVALFVALLESLSSPFSDEAVPSAILLIVIVSFAIAVGCAVPPLVFYALPGTVGPNRYGPDPLHPDPVVGSSGAPPYDSPSRSEPEPEGRRFCSQCGMQLQRDEQFCAGCGAAK